jgi:hypothetical protein
MGDHPGDSVCTWVGSWNSHLFLDAPISLSWMGYLLGFSSYWLSDIWFAFDAPDSIAHLFISPGNWSFAVGSAAVPLFLRRYAKQN